LSDMNLNNLQGDLMPKISPENKVFSDIVKELYSDLTQYETDVPQNFERPCFLFINPCKSSRTEELTMRCYKQLQEYEMIFFGVIDDVEMLTEYKNSFIDYLLGVKKIPIPESDRFFTIERVSENTNDTESLVIFTVEISRVLARNLRRPVFDKISGFENSIIIH